MKKIHWILALIFFLACERTQRSTSEESEHEIVVGEASEISDEEVEELVVMLMINNRLKTTLALLAQEKSVNPRVASFSQLIIDNHDHFQTNMSLIAQTYQIEPPSGLTPEAQEVYDRLQGLEREEFQREFLNFTIQTHEFSIERFQRLMMSTGRPIERGILQEVNDTLQQHLEIAQNLQDEIIAGN